MTDSTNVLHTWPQSRWDDYLTGYTAGYADGIDRGRQIEHEEVAAIQRAGARIVHSMATIPPRDRADDLAAAERRDARWSK